MPWIFLWLLVAGLEVPIYIHTRPAWQTALILASSLIGGLAFLWGWRAIEPRRLPALLIGAPLSTIGILFLVYGLRFGLFSLAGSHYEPPPADFMIAYLIIKTLAFYGLWVGLDYGARMVAEATHHRTRLAEFQMARTKQDREPLARIQIPVGDRTKLLDAEAITWLEADDNYVQVHTDGQHYALRQSLQTLLDDLGDRRFARIHKSAAVNVAEIETLQPLGRGDAELFLRNGTKLRVSRRYRSNLQHLLTP